MQESPCGLNGHNDTTQHTEREILLNKESNIPLKTTNFSIIRQSENSEGFSNKPNLSSTQILPHILDSLWKSFFYHWIKSDNETKQ